jgi:hypothetical protein
MEGHSGLPIIDYMVFCFRRYCSCLSVLSIEHGHVYLNRGSVSVLVLLLQDSSWQDMECMAGWLDAESDTARGLDWTHCGERLSLLSLYDFDCLCTASKGCALSFFVQYHNFLYHLSKSEEVGDGMYFLRSLVLTIRTPHFTQYHWGQHFHDNLELTSIPLLQFQVNKTHENCIPDEHYIQTLLAVSLSLTLQPSVCLN